jgi:ComEC/Rec2-related protein
MAHAKQSPPFILLIRAALAALLSDVREWRSWYFFRRPVLWTLAIFCATFAAVKNNDRSSGHGAIANLPFLNQRVCLTGIVDAQPDKRPTGCIVSVQLETVTMFVSTSVLTQSTAERVLVTVLGNKIPAISPGDRVRACGSLRAPSSSAAPGTFDYADFLTNRDVRAVMYTGPASFYNWGDSGLRRWQRWGWSLKQFAERRFQATLAPQQAAVMAGLVVGERPRFHPELREIFLRSGTMHVLVASGSNVAFVMLLWFVVLRALRVPSAWALGASFAPVWAYVLISGGDAPIVRAAIMGSTLTLAHLLRRWDRPFNALGLAAWIILIAKPRSLFDVGFQMSFVTVTGLMLTMPSVEPLCARKSVWLAWPLRVLAASVIAELWLIPVSVHSFHYIYPLGIFSNMLVVPMAGLGLPMGLAVIISTKMAALVGAYAQALLWLVGSLAAHLGLRWWLAPFPLVAVVAYYVVCAALPRSREKTLAGCAVVAGSIVFTFAQLAPGCFRRDQAPLTLSWVKTGRALATLVESRRGDRVLVLPRRAAEAQNLERTLLPFLVTSKARPIRALLTENAEMTTSVAGQELLRSCSIADVRVCTAPIAWVEAGGHSALLVSVFTTRAQRYLLQHMHSNPDVIAAHFPPNWHWDDEFVKRFKPTLVIETAMPRQGAGNNSPWPDVRVVFPQKQGWYEWSAPASDVKMTATP